jgi:hypothetical protein
MAYHAETAVDISYGRYIWCGNGENISSGFYLNPTTTTDQYGNPHTYFMSLFVILNEPLFEKTTIVELYDYTGFLFGYSTCPISNRIVVFHKKIRPDHIGTSLRIRCCYPKNVNRPIFSRPPMEVVFEDTIVIPDITIKSDNVCKVCLDDVSDPKTRYISPCGHTLHMNCLWQYLRSKDRLLPIPNRCLENGCCNSHKYRSFKCLYCDRLIVR